MEEGDKDRVIERDRGVTLLIFFELECGIIISLLEGGVVEKQPSGEPCLLYLIGTESMTP